MCIEDAAVLAEMFRNVSTGDDEQISRRAKLYQDLRQPRTTRCHRRAQALGASFGQPDGEGQRKRDAATRTAQAKKANLPPQGDPNAHPLSNEFDNWLEQYDAVEGARKALQTAGLPNLQTSKLWIHIEGRQRILRSSKVRYECPTAVLICSLLLLFIYTSQKYLLHRHPTGK